MNKKEILAGLAIIAAVILGGLALTFFTKDDKGKTENKTTTVVTSSITTSEVEPETPKITTKNYDKTTTTAKETTTTTKTKTEVTKVTYSCPHGYKLNGTNCEKTTIKKTVASCPSKSFEINGICVELTNASRIDSIKECGKNTFPIDNKGHTREEKGVLITIPGAYYCVYGVSTDTKDDCLNHSRTWVNNTCYYSKTDSGKNITNTCKSGYTYVSDPNTYDGVNGMNDGCFKNKDHIVNCPDGQVGSIHPVDGPVCTKTDVVPATKN